jgi:L-serine deaminase
MFYRDHNEGMECHPKKIKIIEDVNDNELVLSSSRMLLEVNERMKNFYKAMKDIMEQTYRRNFHLQYKNQSNDSKNQVISKLHEAF